MKDAVCANLSRLGMFNIRAMGRQFSPEKDFFISIRGMDDTPLECPIEANTLHLAFWDTDDETEQFAPTTEHAAQIAEHIRKARAKRANLWVNCIAGISRSGAVVHAATQLGWKDLGHDWQEQRFPNPLLYKLLRKEFPTLKPLQPLSYDQFWGPRNWFNPGVASKHFGE